MMMNIAAKQTRPRVMLAMPVYNEEKHIQQVLDEVHHYIDNVMVIDDGSTDKTGELLASRSDVCVISHKHNCGYGRAITQAFQFAAGCGFEWVISMDCDFQHEPALIPDFLAAIEADDADIINGSRYMSSFPHNDSPPADRRGINKTITSMVNEKLQLNLTDTFCGFKACRLSAMKQLELTEPGYAFPMQFWVQVAFHRLRIREIPVSLIYNDPQRCFGGNLDNPDIRLNYYTEVFQNALAKIHWNATGYTQRV